MCCAHHLTQCQCRCLSPTHERETSPLLSELLSFECCRASSPLQAPQAAPLIQSVSSPFPQKQTSANHFTLPLCPHLLPPACTIEAAPILSPFVPPSPPHNLQLGVSLIANPIPPPAPTLTLSPPFVMTHPERLSLSGISVCRHDTCELMSKHEAGGASAGRASCRVPPGLRRRAAAPLRCSSGRAPCGC